MDPGVQNALVLRPYDILLSAAGRVARIGFVGPLEYGQPLIPARSLVVIRHRKKDQNRAIALYMWLRSVEGRDALRKVVFQTKKGNGVRRLSKSRLEEIRIPDLEPMVPRLVEAFETSQILRAIIRYSRPCFALLQIHPEQMVSDEFVRALRKGGLVNFLRHPRLTARRLNRYRVRANKIWRKHDDISWNTLVANGPYGLSKKGNSRFKSVLAEWIE
ncbi:MAG: hypothetical protein JNM27_11390 [Leptospirales bacterium]|nr:hypothetical protein [Leptospirales bacterium]